MACRGSPSPRDIWVWRTADRYDLTVPADKPSLITLQRRLQGNFSIRERGLCVKLYRSGNNDCDLSCTPVEWTRLVLHCRAEQVGQLGDVAQSGCWITRRSSKDGGVRVGRGSTCGVVENRMPTSLSEMASAALLCNPSIWMAKISTSKGALRKNRQ